MSSMMRTWSGAIGVMAIVVIAAACSAPSGGTPTASPSSPSSASSASPSRRAITGPVHLRGVSYGPFHAGQQPDGVRPTATDIAADIPTLAALADTIRIYSSQGSATAIVRDAAKVHLSVNLGIWLGSDATANEREMAAGMRLMTSSAVTTVTVGNEVLFRGDLPEATLRSYVDRVRGAAARLSRAVRVTVADTNGMWLAHPGLADNLDVITANIYPFWGQVPVEEAAQAFDASYRALTGAFPSKTVIIGETGWPSTGPAQGRAVPGVENQARYLVDFLDWTTRQATPVEYFYFEAFDEAWKVSEAGVGTHWGLYSENGTVKEGLRGVVPAASSVTLGKRSVGARRGRG